MTAIDPSQMQSAARAQRKSRRFTRITRLDGWLRLEA